AVAVRELGDLPPSRASARRGTSPTNPCRRRTAERRTDATSTRRAFAVRSAPAARAGALPENRVDAWREADLKRVERERHEGVVPDKRHQLDHAFVAEQVV